MPKVRRGLWAAYLWPVMTARCASCSYPLTITDSITCYECTSYFHIDCAQLVGFPFYELSSDPNRNTFHCATCKLLPLPGRQCDSDSDSDGDMPSRQLDCALEGQVDIVKDMHEVKGSVQDLSDLCKDMLREINDLKSVNLTLRCCIENLRHDNEERDKLIAELNRRLELMEKNRGLPITKHGTSESDSDRTCTEREEDTERYLTPDPEYSKAKELENALPDNVELDHKLIENDCENTLVKDTVLELSLSQKETTQDVELGVIPETKKHKAVEYDHFTVNRNKAEELPTEDIEDIKPADKDEEVENIEEIVEQINADFIAGVTSKDKESEQDEDLKENQTEEEKGIENTTQRKIVHFEDEPVEDPEDQEWEILNEEIQTEASFDQDDVAISEPLDQSPRNSKMGEENKYQEGDEGIEDEQERSSTEELGKSKTQFEEELREREENDTDVEDLLEQEELFQSESLPKQILEEETTESVADEGEEKVPEEGAEVETSAPEEGDGEKNPAVEGEEPSEGVVLTEGEARLEGEVPPTFEGEAGEKRVEVEGEQPLGAEGELRLADQQGLAVEGEPLPEGQSLAEEEVQAAELPPPPEPEHTEEDLWEYLRDTVSSVHPATVEEFLENLIGTLQQVPQEYLKPVIEANVKRATSPSVTDGDHLPLSEDVPLEGEAAVSTGEVPPTEEADSASPPEVALAAEGETLLEESAAPTEVSSELAEDSTAPENTEGYPALEATA